MVQQNFLSQEQQQTTDTKKEGSPFNNLSKSVTSLGSRLRVIEERYANIRKKTKLTDQNLLNFEKDIRFDIRTLNEDLLEIKRSVSELNENLIQMSSELGKSVKQHEFKIVEKYVDMWQPMDFITREEFNKYLKKRTN